MYNGKFSGKRRRLLKTRQLVILTSMALLLVGLVGGSLAYLFMSTESVDNTFTAARVTTNVLEDNTQVNVKSDVKIQNTGNISAYIRAAVVINWQKENGEIYGEVPVKDRDYTIEYGTDWTYSDGFYYYNGIVSPNGVTGNLIERCEVKKSSPEGASDYKLTVTILGSGIQAKGMGAANAQDAWTKAASN